MKSRQATRELLGISKLLFLDHEGHGTMMAKDERRSPTAEDVRAAILVVVEEMLEKYPRDRRVIFKRNKHVVGNALWFALDKRGVRWPSDPREAERMKKDAWDAIFSALEM
jgi:hypothetical protein